MPLSSNSSWGIKSRFLYSSWIYKSFATWSQLIQPNLLYDFVFQRYWTYLNYYYICLGMRKLKINDLYKIIRHISYKSFQIYYFITFIFFHFRMSSTTTSVQEISVSQILQDPNELFLPLIHLALASTPLYFKLSLYHSPSLDHELFEGNCVLFTVDSPVPNTRMFHGCFMGE